MNLKGVKTLGKTQQKLIFGGGEGTDTIGGGSGGGTCTVRCNDGRLLDVMDCDEWADGGCGWGGWTVCVC